MGQKGKKVRQIQVKREEYNHVQKEWNEKRKM
jgi:hypothetical protein